MWSVNANEPALEEVQREVSLLKHDKAPGPDDLHPTMFKEGGKSFITSLTKSLRTVWTREQIPREWNHSTVIPVFKKGARNLCENHRGIILLTVASKVLSGLILRRLTNFREGRSRENQAVSTIFLPQDILELYQQLSLVAFLNLKSAFESVNRQALFRCWKLKWVPSKF